MNNWKNWLRGLAAVAIGGAATGAANALGNGRLDKTVAVTAGVGALSTVVAYLLHSPLAVAGATSTVPVEEPAAEK